MSGFEGDGIKVKVERMLVLFCSCAVQREVQRKLETIQRSYLFIFYYTIFIFYFVTYSFQLLPYLFFFFRDKMCEKETAMVVEEVQVGESPQMSRRLDTLESLIRELTNKEDGKPKERSRSKSSKKREHSSSESELSSESSSSSDSEEEGRRSRRKKKRMSTKEKKKAKKEEKRRLRLERARKREWRVPSHREQFAVLDKAIKPIQAAKARARKEGISRALREDLDEGEAVLLQRVKLLLLADSKGWVAARISGQADVGSDSEDERRVRAATAEAARDMAQGRPFRPRRAAADGQQPAIQPAIREKPPTPQPRITRNSGPPDCWSCGERGHVQWSCPRRLGGAARSQERTGAAATPTGASR